MYYGLSYKSKQFFLVFIKLAIVVGASYYIYNRLIHNNELDFQVFMSFLSKNVVFTPKNVILVLFLTIFNWFFEILKWKKLVSAIKNISLSEATKQSLSALTASLFTPNRIGEYGAKAVYFSKLHRKRILLLNLMGNVFQMSVTLVLGIIGLYIFVSNYDIEISFYRVSRFGIVLLLVGALATFGISQKRIKIKGFSMERIMAFIKEMPFQKKGLAALYSVIRYFIFSFQFFFLMTLLGVELPYFEAMVGITTMYLFSSIIPTLFIFDVVVKGSIAVYVFGYLGVNELTILCVITMMWLLNFVLPSVFGSFYVLNFNFTSEDE